MLSVTSSGYVKWGEYRFQVEYNESIWSVYGSITFFNISVKTIINYVLLYFYLYIFYYKFINNSKETGEEIQGLKMYMIILLSTLFVQFVLP